MITEQHRKEKTLVSPTRINKKLLEICQRTSTISPGQKPDEYFTYVDVSSVSNSTYQIAQSQQMLGSKAPSRARKLIREGDVIFATVRPTLQRIALVPQWLDGQVCSTGYCVLRPDQSLLDSEYLYYFLLTEEVSEYVGNIQTGAIYPAINDSDLFNLTISLPPLPEQRAIARVLRSVQDAIAARRRELELERERKATLMQHLFTYGTRGEPTKMSGCWLWRCTTRLA